jgi:hypothetical protein
MGPMADPGPIDQQPIGATILAHLMAGSGGVSKDAKLLPRRPAVVPVDVERTPLALPGRAMLLDRLVTPGDYARLLARVPGVAKARADSVTLPAARPTLLVTVVADLTREPDLTDAALLERVRDALRASQAAGARPALVRVGELVRLRAAMRLWVAAGADIVAAAAAARAALLSRFGFAASLLARDIVAADLLTVAQALPGVLGAELTHLYRTSQPRARLDRVVAPPGRFEDGAARAAQIAYLSEHGDDLRVTAAVAAMAPA